MVNLVLDSFGKNEVIHCDKVYRVVLGELLSAFKKVFNYNSHSVTGLLDGEKIIEDIPESINVLDANPKLLEEMIQVWNKSKFEE